MKCSELNQEYLQPFKGESNSLSNNQTLHNKIVCGYQGWFRTPTDTSGLNDWGSYGKNGYFKPASCSIDLWPDVSELDDDEKFDTEFKLKDGKTAQVFSSSNRKTLIRHCKWLSDYNIDGIFIQRFYLYTVNKKLQNTMNKILSTLREGCNKHNVCYALMYDLSGMKEGSYENIINDWKRLVDCMHLTKDDNDKSYYFHNNKPVVTLWGIGFGDDREYTLQDCMKLVNFFKDDDEYGGNTVMIGVPTGWREQSINHFYVPHVKKSNIVMEGDAIQDKYLHEIIKKVDIVSPWTVDRFETLKGAEYIAKNIWKKDMEWLNKYDIEFMPVVFPGFSWHNLNNDQKFNQIPRQQGKFLWKQYFEAIKLKVPFIYQAMFDEINESTAIFKCTNDFPVGESPFVDYEGLSSDFYLKLIGMVNENWNQNGSIEENIPKQLFKE